jgi:acyl-CoA synthetase (AMP-forming)/AMP-acid ligase II
MQRSAHAGASKETPRFMSQKSEDVMDLPPLARRTLAAVLEGHLRVRADQMAVRDTERGMSYAALYEEALAFAAGFSQLGVARQEPVLLMLDNHLDFVIAWWALSLTGRVEVPVNTAYKVDPRVRDQQFRRARDRG